MKRKTVRLRDFGRSPNERVPLAVEQPPSCWSPVRISEALNLIPSDAPTRALHRLPNQQAPD